MTRDQKINHEYTMTLINNARTIADVPNGYTKSKIQTELSKLSKYKNYNKISSTMFSDIASLLVAGAEIDSKVVQLFLNKLCIEYFEEDSFDAREYLTNSFMSSEELKCTIEEVRASLKKISDLALNDFNKEVHLYIIPKRPTKVGGKFHTIYLSKNEKLDLNEIVMQEFGKSYLEKNKYIYSDDIDTLEDIIRLKYDGSFRRIGGIILKKFESIGSINFFEPRKVEDKIDSQIEEMESAISNMTIVRDGLSSEILKMQKSLEKIKTKNKQ